MSLEPLPFSLPPEASPEQSSPAVEKSYTRRLIQHASQKTREHNKVELIAGLLGAAVIAAATGAWGSVGLGVLAFVMTLVVLFVLYLLSSAKELDKQLRQELSSARLLLEEEKAKNTKPDIQGEVIEVFFDKSYSLIHSGPTDSEEFRHYHDFFFTVRVYVMNQGAATTIKGFKFVLRSNGNSKDGAKESLKDYFVERRENAYTFATGQIIQDALVDIEDLNDQPLEHSRNGWLRFGVEGIPEIKSDMEIELSVIDKKGDSHLLNSLPQLRWQQNSQDNYPQIVYIKKGW
jgi:hypothetical protein